MNTLQLKILLLLVCVALVISYNCKSIEKFTVAKRNGLLCNPLASTLDDKILPNSASIVLQGYNYEETPIIYRDGQKIAPLKFSRDYTSMAYFFVVSDPKGFCNSTWIIETSDFVQPVVNDGRTGHYYKVSLLRRRNKYNKWLVSC